MVIRGSSEGAVTSDPLDFRPMFVPSVFACVQYVSVNLAKNPPPVSVWRLASQNPVLMIFLHIFWPDLVDWHLFCISGLRRLFQPSVIHSLTSCRLRPPLSSTAMIEAHNSSHLGCVAGLPPNERAKASAGLNAAFWCKFWSRWQEREWKKQYR